MEKGKKKGYITGALKKQNVNQNNRRLKPKEENKLLR